MQGGSERDGLKEGEYTLRFLQRNFRRLKEFRIFADIDLEL
jgi:hypothetical protein